MNNLHAAIVIVSNSQTLSTNNQIFLHAMHRYSSAKSVTSVQPLITFMSNRTMKYSYLTPSRSLALHDKTARKTSQPNLPPIQSSKAHAKKRKVASPQWPCTGFESPRFSQRFRCCDTQKIVARSWYTIVFCNSICTCNSSCSRILDRSKQKSRREEIHEKKKEI